MEVENIQRRFDLMASIYQQNIYNLEGLGRHQMVASEVIKDIKNSWSKKERSHTLNWKPRYVIIQKRKSHCVTIESGF